MSLQSVFLFFFSSRRRHTRSLCDWSSDVCSSDLQLVLEWCAANHACRRPPFFAKSFNRIPAWLPLISWILVRTSGLGQIGRASCRKRVEILVVDASLTKKIYKAS